MPHTHLHKHTLQLGTCTYIHVCDVCVCVCACICVRVVVYIFTLVLVLAIFTPPAHFTRRLWLLFLHYFLHISISGACLQFGTLFFFFLFCCFALPCTHDFQSPVAFKRSRQTERKRTESEKRAAAAAARAAGEWQGCCCCCTHLRLLHSPVCQSSVGLRDSLLLSVSFFSVTGYPGRVPCLSPRRRTDFWRKWWSLLTIFLLIYSGPRL